MHNGCTQSLLGTVFLRNDRIALFKRNANLTSSATVRDQRSTQETLKYCDG